MRNILIALIALTPFFADASVKVYSNTGQDLGHFNEIQCGPGLECSKAALSKAKIAPIQNYISASTGSTTLTRAQCGSTITNTGAATFILPNISADGAVGCRFTFIVGAASNLTIDPATTGEQIMLLTNAAGDRVAADAVGESLVLEAFVGGVSPKWAPVAAEKGTWTDSN